MEWQHARRIAFINKIHRLFFPHLLKELAHKDFSSLIRINRTYFLLFFLHSEYLNKLPTQQQCCVCVFKNEHFLNRSLHSAKGISFSGSDVALNKNYYWLIDWLIDNFTLLPILLPRTYCKCVALHHADQADKLLTIYSIVREIFSTNVCFFPFFQTQCCS